MLGPTSFVKMSEEEAVAINVQYFQGEMRLYGHLSLQIEWADLINQIELRQRESLSNPDSPFLAIEYKCN